MADEEIVEPVTEIVEYESIFPQVLDAETEKRVDNAVTLILQMDGRFLDPDIEVVDAIRDWVRAEAVLAKAFAKFMTGDTTASTERMFRFASLHKIAIRDEVFKKYKGRRAKKDEIDFANTILVDEGIIKPETEVDILADRKT